MHWQQMSKLVTSKKLVEVVRGLEVRRTLEHLSWGVWTRVIVGHLQYDAFGDIGTIFRESGAKEKQPIISGRVGPISPNAS